MSEHDAITKELIKLAEENGQLNAKIDALHRMIDKQDTEAEESYVVSTIPTSYVRVIFGWKLCDGAKNARIEREARIAKIREEMEREDARMDERAGRY